MSGKSKKLLVVGGGRSIHTYNFINLVGDYFSDIMLLTDYEDKNHSNIKKCVVDFSFHNPIKILHSYISIRRLLKDYKPDFIACYQVDTAAFLTLLSNKKHIPTLVTAMGSDILLNQHKGFFHKFLIKYVLNKAKYHNTGALHVAQQMQQLANKPLEVVVANLGFDNDIAPQEKQNIVYSNRLHKPLYQIPHIIRAFAKFYKYHSDWRLVVAASGDEETLAVLADELGIKSAVSFVGWLDRQANNHFYEISRLWVSIPQSDCTPISLMEAMAAGCIPIVSNLPTMRQWIEDGKTGIIVEDLDSNFMERALQLDYTQLLTANNNLMIEQGSKEANRKKFYGIFNKEFGSATNSQIAKTKP
ncbi:MAG: glycosyltransferase family 4 protein [Bacteroidales bacterium]|jgi:glycosyltransferase involved in cell wall biosynthesis|nr:glycosyltransferase family 4 protein [Bacteroidales bacterium]